MSAFGGKADILFCTRRITGTYRFWKEERGRCFVADNSDPSLRNSRDERE